MLQHELTWYGHANFHLVTEHAKIIIDPFFEGNPSAPVAWDGIGALDLVLVTHDHGDHVGQAVELCCQTGAMLGAIVGTAEKLVAAGVPQEQVINGVGFNIGGTVTHKGIRVTMTQAYHSSESGASVGYIITLPDGYTIYHAGDTCVFSDMQIWGQLHAIDVALLPIGGVFTMDPEQAALACQLLQARAVVPMHWGTFPVLEANTARFKGYLTSVAPKCRLLDMELGTPLTLSAEALFSGV